MASVDWTADAKTFSRTKSTGLRLTSTAEGLRATSCSVALNPQATNSPCQATQTPDPTKLYKVEASVPFTEALDVYAEDRVGLPPIAPKGVKLLGKVLDYTSGSGFSISEYWLESGLEFLFGGRLADVYRVLDLSLPLVFKNGVGCVAEACTSFTEETSREVGNTSLIGSLTSPILTTQVGIPPASSGPGGMTPDDGITRFVGPPTSITWDEKLTGKACLKYSNGLLSVRITGEYLMYNVKEQKYLQKTAAAYTGANRSWDVVEGWNYWGSNVLFQGSTVEVGTSTLAVDAAIDVGSKPKLTYEFHWRATVPATWRTAGVDVTLPLYSKSIARAGYWLSTGGPSNTVEPTSLLADPSLSGPATYTAGNVPSTVDTTHTEVV